MKVFAECIVDVGPLALIKAKISETFWQSRNAFFSAVDKLKLCHFNLKNKRNLELAKSSAHNREYPRCN
jgi:hypothetical protein